MKTFFTILAALMLAVSIMLLIQYHEKHGRQATQSKPDDKLACAAGSTNPECQSTSIQCGLDTNGHIVPDGKGGCIPPPPSGRIASFDISSLIPICDRAVGASKDGKCVDNDGNLVDRSEYDRRPTHTGEPVPFCDKGANMYNLCWDRNTKSIVNKSEYDQKPTH